MPRPWHELSDPVLRDDCTCADCWSLPTVARIGDLTARHIGRTIAIPDLHQPGTDYDAPGVTVAGKLVGLSAVPYGKGEVWVKLAPKTADLDRPLPTWWPCEVAP